MGKLWHAVHSNCHQLQDEMIVCQQTASCLENNFVMKRLLLTLLNSIHKQDKMSQFQPKHCRQSGTILGELKGIAYISIKKEDMFKNQMQSMDVLVYVLDFFKLFDLSKFLPSSLLLFVIVSGICVWFISKCVQVHETIHDQRPEKDVQCPVLSLSSLLG